MAEPVRSPQINVSKIVVGGGVAGAIFTIGSMALFLVGLPEFRLFLPAAAVLGCGVALVIHFVRHDTPRKSWILPATKKQTGDRPPAHDVPPCPGK
jgi:hypothetical protein